MSRYAFLICEEAKEFIWLGKIVDDEATGVRYFHIGDPERPPNSENPVLMKAIMKFLAQHMGKIIKVLPEEQFDDEFDDESVVAIGGDAYPCIPFANYIADFRG